ncbi:hypothetical protein O181_046720 [Austropuccinia psidii MF-1]|uniref:Retrovirus-related Pol polyprotein from transposon TNT 1-94-like beta-barrel domain-containing protein n=1 Tax=Austropuccinia psidii MF-1 TaxID=1389203 RepID=A0A9Q3DTY2_9BASI|nr:hypothetical protein [Austropuccinia psidii MF-1]
MEEGWATGHRGPAEEEPEYHPGEAPGDTLLVLRDSRSTHHVTRNATLFTEYKKVDLTLSVASAKQHPVGGKGIINLACPSGNVRLTEVLHFPDIPGTMLSIGKFVTGRTPDLTPLNVSGCKACKRLVVLGGQVKGAWAVFDENEGQAIKGRIQRVSTIQIQNVFDLSMIKEIRYQDEHVELTNVSASLHSDAPGSYGEVIALDDQQKWKEAISTKIARMERWRCGWRYQRMQHPWFWAQDVYSRSIET